MPDANAAARRQGRLITMQEHEHILGAVHLQKREELGKLAMQVVLYREALEEAGIEPPDRTGAELLQLWQDSARVIAACADLLHTYGTSKELILQHMSVSRRAA